MTPNEANRFIQCMGELTPEQLKQMNRLLAVLDYSKLEARIVAYLNGDYYQIGFDPAKPDGDQVSVTTVSRDQLYGTASTLMIIDELLEPEAPHIRQAKKPLPYYHGKRRF